MAKRLYEVEVLMSHYEWQTVWASSHDEAIAAYRAAGGTGQPEAAFTEDELEDKLYAGDALNPEDAPESAE